MAKKKSALNRLSAPFNIDRGVYAMAMDGDSADVELYGDIVEQQPIDFWTGRPIEGKYIILDDFLADFEWISKAKNITFHINSYGGDCMVGMVIHNKIRELSREGKNVSCIVDGVAMSAASVIMSACDTVKVNAASLVMIHKCWSFFFGGYNADELRETADSMDAYDKALASAYVRKSGMSQTQILHMMADTTYMTGKEAVEKGFADEVLEDEPVQIAASADGRSLFVGGKEMHLAPGMFAPDFIPTVTPDSEKEDAASDETIVEEPIIVGSTEGGQLMTLEELRAQYPELIAQAEAEATAAGNAEAINSAVQAERTRMHDIDEIACLYDAALVNEAKYGETACSAAELAHRAALAAAKSGQKFLANMEEDGKESGAEEVGAAPAPEEEDKKPETEEEKLAAARAQVKATLGKN